MANIQVTNNPFIVVAADTAENQLIFPNVEKTISQDYYEVGIRVLVGTFTMNTLGDASAGATMDDTDGLVILTLSNKDKLRFQAGSISDSFKVYF